MAAWEPSTAAAPGGGLPAALRRIGPVLLFAALPAAVVIGMFVVGIESGPLALDFHQELYPQAKEILSGGNPFPAIWPPLATVVVMPLTVLPPMAADIAIGLLGLACFGLALWIVGVRDWRVYGTSCLWPQVVGEIRISHLTPLLCLLTALVWRYRDAPLRSGLALGVAGGIKFLLWPIGLWLVATRRTGAAIVALVVAAGSLLLILPYTGIDDYLRVVLDVSRNFDQDSYSTFGALVRLGAPDSVARIVTFALGAILIALMWRRQSFALAIGAALLLSPIIWQDFFALAAIPLAIVRPRLSVVWFLPLLTWGATSSGIAIGLWNVVRLLVVFSVVLLVAARAERSGPAP